MRENWKQKKISWKNVNIGDKFNRNKKSFENSVCHEQLNLFFRNFTELSVYYFNFSCSSINIFGWRCQSLFVEQEIFRFFRLILMLNIFYPNAQWSIKIKEKMLKLNSFSFLIMTNFSVRKYLDNYSGTVLIISTQSTYFQLTWIIKLNGRFIFEDPGMILCYFISKIFFLLS